jgi:outer membrane autotransporter protein
MQFANDGFTVQDDGLRLSAGLTPIRVGDGTQAGADYTTTITSVLSGAGGVNKTDLGRLVLGGVNTYQGDTTVSHGTLEIAGGGSIANGGVLTNAGTVIVDAGGALSLGGIVNQASGVFVNHGTVRDDLDNAGVYTNNGVQDARVASNTGTIHNAAGATWTGDFNNTGGVVNNEGAIIGSLTQTAGATVNNAAISGAVAIVGGAFGGTGSSGNLTVGRGAVFQPGTGTAGSAYAVNGNLSLAPGATYAVNVNPGAASSTHATGTASLGGTVSVLVAAGNYAPSSSYVILSADGGLGGSRFDGEPDSNLAFLAPSLTYSDKEVALTLTRNGNAFSIVADTPNQGSIADGVASLANDHPVVNAIIGLDAAGARAAFDRLSGEIHASAKSAMVEDSFFVQHAMTSRLRGALDDTVGKDTASVWVNALGAKGSRSSDGNAAGLDRSVSGFFVGGDTALSDHARIGAMAGFSRSSYTVGDRASSGTSDNLSLGLYGGARWGDLALRSGAAYTRHNLSTSRSAGIPGSDNLKGHYDAGTTQVFGEVGYGLQAGAVRVEPFANLAYVNLSSNGFTETGGAAALAGRSGSTGTTFSTLGVHASTELDVGTAKATAKATIGWRHAFGGATPASTLSFAGGSDAFTVAGTPIARNAAVVNAGLDFAIGRNTTLGVSYNGQFGSGVRDHGVRASLLVKF